MCRFHYNPDNFLKIASKLWLKKKSTNHRAICKCFKLSVWSKTQQYLIYNKTFMKQMNAANFTFKKLKALRSFPFPWPLSVTRAIKIGLYSNSQVQWVAIMCYNAPDLSSFRHKNNSVRLRVEILVSNNTVHLKWEINLVSLTLKSCVHINYLHL